MELHIQIKTAGNELPTPEEAEIRWKLEDAIMDKALGKIVDSGGGMGNMDIFVEVADDNSDKARGQIEALIKELNIPNANILK